MHKVAVFKQTLFESLFELCSYVCNYVCHNVLFNGAKIEIMWYLKAKMYVIKAIEYGVI